LYRRVCCFGAIFGAIALLTSGAVIAQPNVPWLIANRPPIAAPVKIIGVNPLPVVRSQSEAIEDIVLGLITGLMVGEGSVEGVAFVAVRDDRVVVRKDFGFPDSDAPFAAGSLSDLVLALAAMQQIEKANIVPDEDLSGRLGVTAQGVTVDQVLTHQRGDPALLAQLVEKASGELLVTYVPRQIFTPLKMTQSAFVGGELRTSLADMAQLMTALLNGGAAGDGRILQPATVQAMERTHFTLHEALPGWSYGFAEARRNGWRALQHDGGAAGVQSRLVLVPDAKLGYFILVRGRAGAQFWRTLDNTLFDRALTPYGDPHSGLRDSAAPSLEAARAAIGVYQPSHEPSSRVAALKIGAARLTVFAADDGSLVLSGAANAVLAPKEGGYWSAEGGNLNAALSKGRLVLSTGIYDPIPPWQRWELYLWVGLALALAMAGAGSYGRRRKLAQGPDDMLLLIGTAAGGCLLLALLMWLLAPVS
jgi:CubicO group peptidase (beta-lactamase class C family)